MKMFSIGENKGRRLHGKAIEKYLEENVRTHKPYIKMAAVGIVEKAWGKGGLDIASTIIAMKTVPNNVYPSKLMSYAWKVCKPSTAATYNATGNDSLEEAAADLVYRKVDRMYVESLSQTVQDYFQLLDEAKYS